MAPTVSMPHPLAWGAEAGGASRLSRSTRRRNSRALGARRLSGDLALREQMEARALAPLRSRCALGRVGVDVALMEVDGHSVPRAVSVYTGVEDDVLHADDPKRLDRVSHSAKQRRNVVLTLTFGVVL